MPNWPEKHANRKSVIHMIPPKGTRERAEWDQYYNSISKPELTLSMKKHMRSIWASRLCQSYNGTGSECADQLREFLNEYMDRYGRAGPEQLPSHFNVGEAFFDLPNRNSPFFQLLPERDHVFAFSDLLEFVTGPKAPSLASCLEALPERTIFTFMSSEPPETNLYSCSDNTQFGFLSTALEN